MPTTSTGIEILVCEEDIEKHIGRLAAEIADFYVDKVNPDNPLVVISVMQSALVFTADLMRALSDHDLPFELRTERIVSGWEERKHTGKTELRDPMPHDKIVDRHVLVVDDLLDSGDTITLLRAHLKKGNPASLKFVVAVVKDTDSGDAAIKEMVDWWGVRLAKHFWLVGYGMDDDRKLNRGCRFIGHFPDRMTLS